MEMGSSTRQQVLATKQKWTLSPLAAAVICVSLALCAMAVWGLANFGSIRDAISYYFKGETLILDSTTKSFGVAAPGERVSISFKLTNRGKTSIRILGCYARCTCLVPGDLPITLQSNEKRDFTVSISMPSHDEARARKSTHLELPFVLFTSSPTKSRVALSVSGEVRDKSATFNSDP